MKYHSLGIAALLLGIAATAAHAHFVWVTSITNAAGKAMPHVVFGEDPEPSEAELLDKVAHTKAWTQLPGKQPQALSLSKEVNGEVGSWVSDVDAQGAAIFATCDYGVLDKNGKTFLLQYYAKKLDATPEQLKSLARTEQLPLDIVPALTNEKGELTVLWQGKPAVDSEVTIIVPGEKSQKLKTDSEGKVAFAAAKPGAYQIRAKWAVDQAGERAGKAYPNQVHYTTLVLNKAAAK